MSALDELCLDCAVIVARNGRRLRRFYQDVLHLPVNQKADRWIEFRIGSELLAIAHHTNHHEEWLGGACEPAEEPPQQLSFIVSREQVESSGKDLARARIPYAFGTSYRSPAHHTLFFRDPEGNVLEFRAEMWSDL
jgi:extradiol dioxygenase family protein